MKQTINFAGEDYAMNSSTLTPTQRAMQIANAPLGDAPERKYIDVEGAPEIGTQIGEWTIKSRPYKLFGRETVDALCSCGTLKPVMIATLRNGKSSSCHRCSLKVTAKRVNDAYPREVKS